MDTPYQWTKQVASHWGGTRNGTIVHWPKRHSRRKGEVRHQFHHVIDVAPTVLEAAGLPAADFVNGVQQLPLAGRRAWPTPSTTPTRPERHETQYFEMFCNRGIYHKGWTAVTQHSTPWVMAARLPAFDDDVWELYGTATTGRRRTTSPQSTRTMLRELQRLWLIEAVKYNVLPLDDRRVERFNPDIAGRPKLIRGNSQLLFGGMGPARDVGVEPHAPVVEGRARCTPPPRSGIGAATLAASPAPRIRKVMTCLSVVRPIQLPARRR